MPEQTKLMTLIKTHLKKGRDCVRVRRRATVLAG